jgi:hypothetical protein
MSPSPKLAAKVLCVSRACVYVDDVAMFYINKLVTDSVLTKDCVWRCREHRQIVNVHAREHCADDSRLC